MNPRILISIIFVLFLMGCESNEDLIRQNLSTPNITTADITNISSESALAGGNITTNGSSEIVERGVVWSTSTNPTIEDFNTSDGSGLGVFTSNLTNLSSNTLYFVRAYARNSNGVNYYGNEVSFTTLDLMTPSITTLSIENITNNSASSGGVISSDGGLEIIERGVVWSTNTNPTIDDFKTTDGSGIGEYSSILTNLSSDTNYFVKAYAINNDGVFYGNEFSFVTLAPEVPNISTLSINNITTVSATSGGNIMSDGGSEIIERGVVWSTNTNPTIDDSSTSDGSGLGEYSSTLTNLSSNTIYYVKAYASNSNGIFYGNEVSFTTLENTTQYAIGDIGPGGGFVFEVDADGFHGKEIAPISTEFQTQWGCPITSVPGTSSAFGTGQSNSILILEYHDSIDYYANPNQCTDVVEAIGDVAAKNCDDLIFNDFNDWYLPSIGELELVYTNLISQGLGDFTNTLLSSSTESPTNFTQSIVLSVSSGGTFGLFKYDLTNHRAIRDF